MLPYSLLQFILEQVFGVEYTMKSLFKVSLGSI